MSDTESDPIIARLKRNKDYLKRFNTRPRYYSSPLKMNKGKKGGNQKIAGNPRHLRSSQTQSTPLNDDLHSSISNSTQGTPQQNSNCPSSSAATEDTVKTSETTILESRRVQVNQHDIINSQAQIIQELRAKVREMGRSIDFLSDQTDRLEQKLLSDRIIFSGPAIHGYMTHIPSAPTQLDTPEAAISHVVTPTSETPVENTENEASVQTGDVVTEGAQSTETDAATRNPVLSANSANRPSDDPKTRLASLLNDVLGLSSQPVSASDIKFTSELYGNRLLVGFRGEVPRSIFQNLRKSKRQLFCNDFLTKTRSEIMFELRELKRNPRHGIELVTPRNGCSMIRYTKSSRLHRIETFGDLNSLREQLENRQPAPGRFREPPHAANRGPQEPV